MSDLTKNTSSGLGAGQLAELTLRGLEQWRSAPGKSHCAPVAPAPGGRGRRSCPTMR
ncbi:hypothetical protein AB4028_13345 [Janibacter sp. RAF20_2_2]